MENKAENTLLTCTSISSITICILLIHCKNDPRANLKQAPALREGNPEISRNGPFGIPSLDIAGVFLNDWLGPSTIGP